MLNLDELKSITSRSELIETMKQKPEFMYRYAPYGEIDQTQSWDEFYTTSDTDYDDWESIVIKTIHEGIRCPQNRNEHIDRIEVCYHNHKNKKAFPSTLVDKWEIGL